ncbi:MAG: glycosyltransferase family 39 protein [Anaerolineae bacterium]|nr:glycosyltransferase family 39 protein [Anaerolineae bacterium]
MKRIHILALLTVLAAFVLTALVSRTTFERLPHLEDEVAYLYQAKIFAGGHMVIETPEPKHLYWQPFVVDYEGRRFGKYPPGWSLLLSVGVLVGQPWVVNAFCATLSVALVYRLGSWIFDRTTGLVAALLLALSPFALLLNGTLMSHTSAMCLFLLWVYGLWKLQHARLHRRRWGWAVFAGVMLGLLFGSRQLTAAGLAAPFFIWAGLVVAWRGLRRFWSREYVQPALLFALAALSVALVAPLFNYAAAGDPTYNLYTLVWEYDRIGFGDCCGPSGHTPVKAFYNMRRDLGLLTSDLFGWQMSQGVYDRLYAGGWRMGMGVSWLLLLPGLLALWRRPSAGWAWALLGSFVCLVAAQWLFWSGAQLYGPRYYFEGIPGLVLLGAAGATGLARFTVRLADGNRYVQIPVYAALLVFCAGSMVGYTPARLEPLWRFNDIGQDDIDALNALRDGRPALVLVTGADQRSWREWGTYMALTSPYLDGDVVAARVRWEADQAAAEARFPGRQVLYLMPDGSLTSEQVEP